MKKIFCAILLCFCYASLSCQTIIKMEENNGIYKIPCLVNGARMKFIFDTGATSVSMSSQMANYLLENDYISKEDIISSGKSSIADGTIIDHVIINLRDVEISGLHLSNSSIINIKRLFPIKILLINLLNAAFFFFSCLDRISNILKWF